MSDNITIYCKGHLLGLPISPEVAQMFSLHDRRRHSRRRDRSGADQCAADASATGRD